MSAPRGYVVGFMLTKSRDRVALVKKARPAWMAGLFNGVGGKVEPTDHGSRAAMAREFEEETGLRTVAWKWEPICSMTWPSDGWADAGKAPRIDFFRYVWHNEDLPVLTVTDEAIAVVDVAALPANVVPNLRWLVPLAAYTADRYEPFTVVASIAETIHPVGYFASGAPS